MKIPGTLFESPTIIFREKTARFKRNRLISGFTSPVDSIAEHHSLLPAETAEYLA
jgi:hypothetical protein